MIVNGVDVFNEISAEFLFWQYENNLGSGNNCGSALEMVSTT